MRTLIHCAVVAGCLAASVPARAEIIEFGPIETNYTGAKWRSIRFRVPPTFLGNCQENGGAGAYESYESGGSRGNPVLNVVEYLCTVPVLTDSELRLAGLRNVLDAQVDAPKPQLPREVRRAKAQGLEVDYFGWVESVGQDYIGPFRGAIELAVSCRYGEFDSPGACTPSGIREHLTRVALIEPILSAEITLMREPGRPVTNPYCPAGCPSGPIGGR